VSDAETTKVSVIGGNDATTSYFRELSRSRQLVDWMGKSWHVSDVVRGSVDEHLILTRADPAPGEVVISLAGQPLMPRIEVG